MKHFLSSIKKRYRLIHSDRLELRSRAQRENQLRVRGRSTLRSSEFDRYFYFFFFFFYSSSERIIVDVKYEIKANNMRSTEVSNAIDLNAAGSRTGGRISSQSSELDSPGIHSTVHSWNSHTNYGNYGHDHPHGSSANAMPWPRTSHLIFYCDIQGHLKTATGLVRLLLLVSTIAELVLR